MLEITIKNIYISLWTNYNLNVANKPTKQDTDLHFTMN